MTVHGFRESLAKSQAQSSAPWWNDVYQQCFGDRLVTTICVRNDGWAQRGGIDRQIILTDGTVLSVDEKVRYKDYPDFLLEYQSDEARKTPGWMQKPLTCDFIAYAFVPSQTCYLLPYQLLKSAWDRNKAEWWAKYRPPIRAQNPGYVTASLAVPIPVVLAAVQSSIIVTWAVAA